MSFPSSDAARPSWLHASHASTAWSPEVARAYQIALSHHREVQSSLSRSRTGGGAPRNVPLTAVQTEALNVVASHRHSRGDHLPSRGKPAEWARLERCLAGYPPIGTAADADELSDEEVAHEAIRDQIANYGERHIVQLGRAKTRYEEELSADDIASHRPRQASPGGSHDAAAAGSGGHGAEGGPGQVVGMQSGQAAQAAAAAAARGEDSAMGDGMEGEEGEEEEGERDLDGSVEDMDDPGRETSLR